MRKWANGSPVMAGVVLVVAGFVVMFLGWNNSANRDFVQGQVPYLISGGMIGLGLVGAGLTVVNVQARRADQAELLHRLEALLEARDAEGPQVAPAPPARTRKLKAS